MSRRLRIYHPFGWEVYYLPLRKCGWNFSLRHGGWLWFTNIICGKRMFRLLGWTVYTH